MNEKFSCIRVMSCFMLRGGGHRDNIHFSVDTNMVRWAREAAAKSSQLDIRAGMEPALHVNGRCGFSCGKKGFCG
jgi:hypothetical protein